MYWRPWMEAVGTANIAGVHKKIVKGDETLKVVGPRKGRTQNSNRADSRLKRAVEGNRLSPLAYERVHRRRSSFTSW
ncbi:MAG: hypothetical protein BroJett026_35370 [Betaproteobacteria bacterium]|nr:MAG: hypothetical protein BroJett026_35370 [Betaproteobacteria bacterium]